MKKLLIILAILFIAAAAAAALFLATFNIDRFRPQIVSQLEKALGRPVAISRLSLAWRNGVAIQCDGLAIYEDAQAMQEPLLQIDDASAQVALKPLFRKSIQIESVLLREPRIFVRRNAQGELNLTGLAAAAAPAGAGQAPAQPAAPGAPQVDVQVGTLQIANGTVHWLDEAVRPPMELWVRALDVRIRNIAPGRPMDVELRAALGGTVPNIQASARVAAPGPQGAGSIEQLMLSVDRLSLDTVVPKGAPKDPRLAGDLTVRASGALPTLAPEAMLGAMTLEGNVMLSDGAIKNVNLLRVVFDRLSMLPGLTESLLARLPQQHQEQLAQQDTALAPLEMPFTVSAGQAHLPDVSLNTETFGLTGAGTVGLDGSLQIRGALQVERELSAAMVRSVNELEALANREGELEIPLAIQGRAPRIVIAPDVNYVASRVAASAATELLGQVFERLGERQSGGAQAPSSTDASGSEAAGQPGAGQADAEDNAYDPLEDLLGRVLAPRQEAPEAGVAPQGP